MREVDVDAVVIFYRKSSSRAAFSIYFFNYKLKLILKDF